MKDLTDLALDTASSQGAEYADIRIARYNYQNVFARDKIIRSISESESFGFGIRTYYKGGWGFASSNVVTKEEIKKIAALSVQIAKASAASVKKIVPPAPVKPYVDNWKTSYKKNPFQVPIDKKVKVLLSTNQEMLKVQNVIRAVSDLGFESEHKYFASTVGSYLEQEIMRSNASATAVARKNGEVKTRTYQVAPLNIGYEHIEAVDMPGHAKRIAEEAVEHCMAVKGPIGKKDLILSPSHLALTIHESVGHPTELDRALGFEADFAGTSFATPDKLNKLKYGSEIVNFICNRNKSHSRSTVGYDDEGVKTGKYYLIKDGIFVGYSTTREFAPMIGEKESRGCAYADSWSNPPILRMANTSLEPGKKGSPTPDELIADTKDGILIDGMGSFSIDHQRNNFQFGGDAFWEIKDGKKTRMLKEVTYQALTTEFWNSCDAMCGPEYWEQQGVRTCGKGQPMQRGQMTHGSAWARFRNISVGGAQR
jgi:TldD protein